MGEIVMIVENDLPHLRILETTLEQLGYRTIPVKDGAAALRYLLVSEGEQPHLVLVVVPETAMLARWQVIADIRGHRPGLPIVALAPYADDDCVAHLIGAGANDFLFRPVLPQRLRITLRNALSLARLSHALASLNRQQNGHVSFSDIVGESQPLRDVLAQARQASSGNLPVWIEGERGVGKELLARAIHGSGERAGKPFVVLDCSSLMQAQAHAAPAGNQANDGQHVIAGKICAAQGGTLFVKDVSAMPPAAQQRLHALLATAADMRVISASAEPSELALHQGFNRALYQRLRGMVLAVPPLRQRGMDVLVLADHFAGRHGAVEKKLSMRLSPQARHFLMSSSWPGNVRQLSSLLWRAVMLAEGDVIDMPELRTKSAPQVGAPRDQGATITIPALLDLQGRIKPLRAIEEEAICYALRHSRGCMSQAARSLGIGRSTLYRRVSELQLGGYISRENQTTRPMMKVSSGER